MERNHTYQSDLDAVKAETEQLSPWLASRMGHRPFGVPAGYFEQLSAQIQSRVSGVPEGYFEDLPGHVMDRIQEKNFQLPEQAPHPYQVPKGYFDQLPQKIGEAKSTGSNVIPLYQRGWAQISVAATLLAGIVATIFFFTRPSYTERQLAKMDETTLDDYVQENIEDYELYQLIEYTHPENADYDVTILPEMSDSTLQDIEKDIDANLIEDLWL